MIAFGRVLLAMSLVQFLAGCSVDGVRRGIYDGVRTRNDLQARPSERFGREETPGYQEYERLRAEQRNQRKL